ncbi:glycosyltransferase family 2 protein [Fodinibacter luteus]|uniref:glycosyltransferase family 2 protein n=1 Tax=Fodinibacter luteus TaxID=552064 RepID=UPI0031E9B765
MTSTSEIPVLTPSSEGRVPAVTLGLPVHNGERYLRLSLDSLLAQTFTDFELIISDNASTDGTAEICREYAAHDRRIRYVRQPTNIGAGPNHNILPPMARAPYFKWASHDDVYDTELLRKCMEVFRMHPDATLVHCWDARIDPEGNRLPERPYTLDTANPSPAARLRSLLHTDGGDDFYGVIRTDVLRRLGPHGSYFNADRVFVAGLSLYGPFHQVPEVLYFRREHPNRLSRASTRDRAAGLDPLRRSRLRHPEVRLYGEYVAGYYRTIRRAPLSAADRWRCNVEVTRWVGTVTARIGRTRQLHVPVT